MAGFIMLHESLSSAPPLLSLLPLEGSTAASATNLELTAYYRTLVRASSKHGLACFALGTRSVKQLKGRSPPFSSPELLV
eukprot:scaffold533_cov369-Prasinococcus_capsulatus_cf.AAC.5